MAATATITTATCYRQENGFIRPESGLIICPSPYQGLCCFPGHDCLDEQICHDFKVSAPGRSGYYIGLCTDATYQSSSCSSRCTDDEQGDVTYNSSTNLWACCGTNESCDKPKNETFLAPPPQQLLSAAASQSAIRATTSSPRPSTTATSNSISEATLPVTSTSSAAEADHTTSSSLNGGAKAAIGVGAAVAAVAILALLIWIILLRRRLRSRGPARNSMSRRTDSMIDKGSPQEAREIAVCEQESDGYGLRHEMEGK